MSPLDLALHLLGFLAPAFALALLAASAAGALWRNPVRWSWPARVGFDFAVGALVLAFGLWHYGTDGKIATYAALVAAVATAEWLASRAWRR